MPKFLEEKLKKEYPGNPSAVYGTLNAIGAMHGNRETAKGRAMQAKHDRDFANKQGKVKVTKTRVRAKKRYQPGR